MFDALTSRRPYKDPLDCETALKLLEQGRGSQFDPRLLDGFAGIAFDLYAEFANQEGEGPRQAVQRMVGRYFKQDLENLIA